MSINLEHRSDFVKRRLKMCLILLIGALVVVPVSILGNTQIASAQVLLDRPHIKCDANDIGDVSADIFVPGNTQIMEVPVGLIKRGDVVRIQASGIIYTGGLSGSHGPDGNDTITYGGWWPYQGGRAYSLYGDWGQDGSKFQAGSDSGCVTSLPFVGGGPEKLYLGINDENLSDNTGGFKVHVRAYHTIGDRGFEAQQSTTISWPWVGEGVDYKGIDRGLGFAHSGANNAFIRTASRNWNAVTQGVPVLQNTVYRLQGWVRTSGNYTTGYFGVRPQYSNSPFSEIQYGAISAPGPYQLLTVDFNSGSNSNVTVFIGYWAPGIDSWVQIDDISLTR
jgi:hypothetical protein